MCVPYDGRCDGWSHTFDQTLHVGDIIVIQKVDPEDININYPISDIIVYQRPDNPALTPVVHRVVTRYEDSDGILHFQTKGDGNPSKDWPAVPSSEDYDSNLLWHTGQGVPENLVIGKVVMRIPWFGHLTLFLRDTPWGLPAIIALILILLVVEFIIPIIRGKKPEATEETKNENIETKTFTLKSG